MRVQSGYWIPESTIKTLIKDFTLYAGSKLLLYLFIMLSSFSIITYKKISGNIDRKDLFKSIESYRWNLTLSNVNRIYLLLVWLLIPIVLPFIISKVSTPIYWDRYTIGASLAFYLLAARGIGNIHFNYVKLLIIAIIILFSLVNIQGYYTKVNKDQWREVANYIDTHAKSEDLILFNAGFSQIPFDYYSKRTDLIKRSFPEKTRDVDEENIKRLGSTVESYNRVWVILAKSNDYKGLIKKTLSESYNLSYGNKYVRIEVYLFEKE